MDQATAARTVQELRIEIADPAASGEAGPGSARQRRRPQVGGAAPPAPGRRGHVRRSSGRRRKLVIFTEHRDTLNYLVDRIRTLLGRAEEVVTIHGGVLREERRKAQNAFTQDKDVSILVATDAAGEGINLQRAHLMINYDLPWNPNRLEQRFGRIHRIGQTEVCHLWNLVADETREGDVYATLLRKLEEERRALGGAVFDVMGAAIDGKELRQLLMEAIRYGDRPEVRAASRPESGRRAQYRPPARPAGKRRSRPGRNGHEARCTPSAATWSAWRPAACSPITLPPFSKRPSTHLGGALHERERNRYEISHVPAVIRQRDRLIGIGAPVLTRYQRICFEKELRNVPGKPRPSSSAPAIRCWTPPSI